ncbi:MAG: sigma 54-interacting transcriptional regulator [Vicinamibacterales bacterium]
MRQTIERVAPSDAAVLITGEHGTGKEVVATWLHAMSDRKSRALVTMIAGGLAEGIAESCSVTSGEHSPTRDSIALAVSSLPTKARCFSTRSPTCR